MTPKEWREKEGLSQEALAEQLGLSDGYISLLEQAKDHHLLPSLKNIRSDPTGRSLPTDLNNPLAAATA